MVSTRRIPAPAALLAALLVTQPGCAANFGQLGLFGNWLGKSAASPTSPALSPHTLTDLDSTELPWAFDEEFFIVVSRPCHRVDLFRWGHLIRRYPAVFGMNSRGGKLHEGDRRTPTGFYAIIEKRPHPRWARFLLIDYPNSTDGDRYARALETNLLPEQDGEIPGIGSAIGIHGSDKESLNEEAIDWTLGCISLTNDDVRDLDALVPVGTPVLIMD